MREFDYTFLEEDRIPGGLINVLTGIYSMNANNETRKDSFVKVFTEWRRLQLSNPSKAPILSKAF